MMRTAAAGSPSPVLAALPRLPTAHLLSARGAARERGPAAGVVLALLLASPFWLGMAAIVLLP